MKVVLVLTGEGSLSKRNLRKNFDTTEFSYGKFEFIQFIEITFRTVSA